MSLSPGTKKGPIFPKCKKPYKIRLFCHFLVISLFRNPKIFSYLYVQNLIYTAWFHLGSTNYYN